MKITYTLFSAKVLTKEYKSVDEFVMLQNREIPDIEDAAHIINVEIDGKPYDFKGSNAADLYFELIK
jgi:hypothetical protein